MAKQIVCQQCGKVYYDDLPACIYCGYSRGAPAAPSSLEDQISTGDPWRPQSGDYHDESGTTEPGRRERAQEHEVTDWPRRRGPDWDSEKTVYDQPQTGLLGWLIIIEGSRRGQSHQVKDGTTIGRDAAELVINDPKMSRPHARFKIQNDQFVLWDFGSANGTYVNGQLIDKAMPLNENDVIKMGDTVFVLTTIK
jgi:hypothetical protein